MIDLTGNLTAVDTSSVKNQIIYELKKIGGTQTLYISDGNVTVHPTDLYGTYKGTLILNVYVWYHIRPQCNQRPEVQDGKFIYNPSYNSGAKMWKVTSGSIITPKMPNGNNIPTGTKFYLKNDSSKYLERSRQMYL